MDKRKLNFTIKIASNNKIIVQRYMFVPEGFIITEEKLKKVALMIDDFNYPKDTKRIRKLDVIVMFELNEEILSYELPITYRWEGKIDIKPIQKEIFDLILHEPEQICI